MTEQSRKHVTEIIGEEYKDWTHEKPVVINSGTGTGKTTFILETLLPYAAESQGRNGRRKILYLVNRTVLKDQLENKLAVHSKAEQECITVMSYQKLAKSFEKKDMYLDYDYYVLDETHYLLSDITFNGDISICIENLWKKYMEEEYRNSVWIFMTATPEYLNLILYKLLCTDAFGDDCPKLPEIPFFDLLANYNGHVCRSVQAMLWYKEISRNSFTVPYKFNKREEVAINKFNSMTVEHDECIMRRYEEDENYENHYTNQFNQYQNCFDHLKKQCQIYSLESQDLQLNPVYFCKWDDIVHAISVTPPQEKWLVFVNTIAEGEKLQQMLRELNQAVVFLYAGNKKKSYLECSSEWTLLKESERFDSRVLITTAVLDNGINISDSSVRHIVVTSHNPITFRQMIGRRRYTGEGDKVNLYLKHEEESSLRREFSSRVLDVVLFLYQFAMHNSRIRLNWGEKDNDTREKYEKYLKLWWSRYAKDFVIKKPYNMYLNCKEDFQLDQIDSGKDQSVKVFRKYDKIVVTLLMYEPSTYPIMRLTYDYYHMMSFFERSYNERKSMLNDFCRNRNFLDCKGEVKKLYENNRGRKRAHEEPEFEGQFLPREKENSRGKIIILKPFYNVWPKGCSDYRKKEEELTKKQFSWLKEQLQWLKLSIDEDNSLDPMNPERWIYYYTGDYQKKRDALMSFLEQNEGFLDQAEEENLQKLCFDFVQTIPYDNPYRNKKMKYSNVQRFFTDFSIPYRLTRDDHRVLKKRRKWWCLVKQK